MRKHKTTILFVWGIVGTLTALYFWNTSYKHEKINSLLNQSIALHKQAIANEAQSYNAINDCFVVRRGLCNAEEFKDTLKVLGDEADAIYGKIVVIENELK